jgi:transposase-like protein
MPRPRKPASPFRYFNSSPEVIRLVVMMYVRFPLSLRNVVDLLLECGIDIESPRRRPLDQWYRHAAGSQRDSTERRCELY